MLRGLLNFFRKFSIGGHKDPAADAVEAIEFLPFEESSTVTNVPVQNIVLADPTLMGGSPTPIVITPELTTPKTIEVQLQSPIDEIIPPEDLAPAEVDIVPSCSESLTDEVRTVPLRSILKRRPDSDESDVDLPKKRQKTEVRSSVQFDQVEIYYFPRKRTKKTNMNFPYSLSSRPYAFGMSDKHVMVKTYTVAEHGTIVASRPAEAVDTEADCVLQLDVANIFNSHNIFPDLEVPEPMFQGAGDAATSENLASAAPRSPRINARYNLRKKKGSVELKPNRQFCRKSKMGGKRLKHSLK